MFNCTDLLFVIKRELPPHKDKVNKYIFISKEFEIECQNDLMLPPHIEIEPVIVGTSCHSPSPPPQVNPHHHLHFLKTRESSFEHHTKWSLSSFWISWPFFVVNLHRPHFSCMVCHHLTLTHFQKTRNHLLSIIQDAPSLLFLDCFASSSSYLLYNASPRTSSRWISWNSLVTCMIGNLI